MIAEKYRLDRLLGRGGMGAVYAGTHLDLDRPIAIKLLLPDFTADADALERFRREARAAARLNHTNVADTYDYGLLPDGGAYIVMEMVDGQTLREYMDAAGMIPVKEAVDIACQVADGIEAAHHRHIVHRDLKPSNIILTYDHQNHLQAKVVDFGVAKLKEQTTTGGGGLTASGSLIGTPRYMSPEQCAGQKIDARSDIYSLGVILFEMLAGRPPFDAPTTTAIAIKHIQEPAPSIKEFRQDIHQELERLISQVLEKDPDERPQTAAAFAEKLEEVSKLSLAPELATEAAQPTSPPALPLIPADDERPEIGRRTGAYLEHRISTQRAGEPTGEHVRTPAPAPVPAPEREPEPSIQAFSAPAETVTEVAAGVDGPGAPRAESPLEEPLAAKPLSPPATERTESYAQTAPRRSRTPLLLAALAVSVAAVTAIGVWLATRGSSSQETAASTQAPAQSAGGNRAPAAQTNGNAAKEPGPAENTNATDNGDAAPPAEKPGDARAQLQGSLNQWVAATNARDLNGQMSLYAPTLSVFYLRRNATRAAVLSEKSRQIAQFKQVAVRIGEPEVVISPDGQTATMRFRKSWNFTGAQQSSGEVVQELRWLRTPTGWRIVSERDLQVIR
jgi:serine/threonine-protein kinase